MRKTTAPNGYMTLKVELTSTGIVRTIVVPEHMTLTDLHDAIQSVMGWHDAHLWQFTDKPVPDAPMTEEEMPHRAGLESSRKVRHVRKVPTGRSRRERRYTAGRMAGCPVFPMNDDPMRPVRGCHPNIIQLDNWASAQRGTIYKCANV